MPLNILLIILLSALCTACADQSEDAETAFPYLLKDDSISYLQHEYRDDPRETKGSLLVLVYDIPYFSGCGVFPPLHVINQIFSSGGGDGGMSPGASWSPFRIDLGTYSSLVDQVRKTDPARLRDRARYTFVKYFEDHTFDSIEDQFDWADATCRKYRNWYLGESAENSGV